MRYKKLKNLKKRPHARGGKSSDISGAFAAFMMVAALAFFRWQMHEALVSSLAILFVLIIVIARRHEQRKSIQNVDKMSGHEFERYLVDVFKASGYKTTLVGEDGADFGADLVVEKRGKKYAVQAKNYAPDVHNVGNDAVQQAIAGATYYDCKEAIVITNSKFTRAAKKQASKSQIIPVTLIPREQLQKMIKKL